MSAMLTALKLFTLINIFITCIIDTNGDDERTRFCDAGTDELFYENANEFSDWAWDDGGDSFYTYYSNKDSNCYTAPCYYFAAADDYTSKLIPNPSFTSVSISTIEHWNIYIIFSVHPAGATTGSCVTSYTVDNGMNFDEIHSAPANPEAFYPKINRSLGTNAENINNLRIKLSIMDTNTDPVDTGDSIECIYDEILICGTVITPAPSAAPTSNTSPPTSNTSPPTVSPTDSDESSSDEVHSDDSGSILSHSSDEIQMYAKQQDQHFIGDDTNNHVYNYKEKSITLSLSSSGVINVMAMFIVFGCVCIVICVYYNNN